MTYLIYINKYLIYNNMDNDIENQILDQEIKKISCTACTMFIGTFVFSRIIVYVLCLSYK